MTTLQNAVIEQLGFDSLDEDCMATLEDVSSHGADSGFSGFIYYTETMAFFEANKAAIIEQLKDDVDIFGPDSVIGLVKSFKCAADSTEDEIGATLYGGEVDTCVANCLAWYALETVAYQLTDN